MPGLFVMLFPVQYMEKRFTLETRESFLIKNERSTETSEFGNTKNKDSTKKIKLFQAEALDSLSTKI